MRLFEVVRPVIEGISQTVFHFTSYKTAANILKNNRFRLNISIATPSDDRFRPGIRRVNKLRYFMKQANGDADLNHELNKAEVDLLNRQATEAGENPDYVKQYFPFMPGREDYEQEDKSQRFMPYYLSTTRQRLGRYHDTSGAGALFTLDGARLGQRYKASPVDYWENLGGTEDRRKESEDRVFSNSPYIENAADYIIKIDVLLDDYSKDNSHVINDLRLFFVASRRRQIPVYFYEDRQAFLLGDERKAVPFPAWKKSKKDEYWPHSGRDYLKVWIELYEKDSERLMSAGAMSLIHNLHWGDSGPGSDMHNAKSNEDRESYHRLLEIFRKEGIRSAQEYKEMVFAKWIEHIPHWLRLFKETNLNNMSDPVKTKLRAVLRKDDRYPVEDDLAQDIKTAEGGNASKWLKGYLKILNGIFEEYGVDHVGFIDIIRKRWAGKVTTDEL